MTFVALLRSGSGVSTLTRAFVGALVNFQRLLRRSPPSALHVQTLKKSTGFGAVDAVFIVDVANIIAAYAAVDQRVEWRLRGIRLLTKVLVQRVPEEIFDTGVAIQTSFAGGRQRGLAQGAGRLAWLVAESSFWT